MPQLKSKYLILTAFLILLAKQVYCNENGAGGVFPNEKHNSLIEVSKIVGGTLLLLGGTGAIILADSPKCDNETPIPGPCTEGEPHPTRNRIVGGSLIAGGLGLAVWGIVNLTENIRTDNN